MTYVVQKGLSWDIHNSMYVFLFLSHVSYGSFGKQVE